MPVTDFWSLAGGLCDIVGVKPPQLEPDEHGTLSFSLALHGVRVDVLSFGGADAADKALLLAELGSVPMDAELPTWLALIEGNSAPAGSDSPRFARSPSGEAVLLWPCPLDRVSLIEVHERIVRMAELAGLWSSDPLTACCLPQFTVDDGIHGEADALFQAFSLDLCTAAGRGSSTYRADDSVPSFQIRVGDAQVTVSRLGGNSPRSALITIHLGTLLPSIDLAVVTSMMEANFVMGLEPDAAALCCDPRTHELLLRYSYPLTGASGLLCLLQISDMVATAKEWGDILRASTCGTPHRDIIAALLHA